MVLPRNLIREKARCCGCLQDEWKTAHQNREQLKYAKINELEEEDVLTIHYIWPIFSIPTALHQLMWWLRIQAGLEFWLRQLKDLYSLSLRLSLSKMYCLNHYSFTYFFPLYKTRVHTHRLCRFPQQKRFEFHFAMMISHYLYLMFRIVFNIQILHELVIIENILAYFVFKSSEVPKLLLF